MKAGQRVYVFPEQLVGHAPAGEPKRPHEVFVQLSEAVLDWLGEGDEIEHRLGGGRRIARVLHPTGSPRRAPRGPASSAGI